MNPSNINKNSTKDFNVTYVKLSVYLRQYLRSRYGKDVVILPLYSPLYGCIEQYLVNNYSLACITNRACPEFAFNSPKGTLSYDGKDFYKPQESEKQEFIAIQMPNFVYRKNGMLKTSGYWQLSRNGCVEFNRLVKADFWRELIRFIDDCFTTAKIQNMKMTRERAISDFITAYDIPMNCYENFLRYDRRIRDEMNRCIENRRTWMESLNDIQLTYT